MEIGHKAKYHTPVSNFCNKYAFIQQLERNIKLRSLLHNRDSIISLSMWMPTMHKALEFYTSKLLYSFQPLLSIPSHCLSLPFNCLFIFTYFVSSIYPFSQELFLCLSLDMTHNSGPRSSKPEGISSTWRLRQDIGDN